MNTNGKTHNGMVIQDFVPPFSNGQPVQSNVALTRDGVIVDIVGPFSSREQASRWMVAASR
jgi:hypothetical protein